MTNQVATGSDRVRIARWRGVRRHLAARRRRRDAAILATYREFIGRIRGAYPGAHIFLTIGPIGHGPDNVVPMYNDEILAIARSEGDLRVHALALPVQDGADGIGADWHPNVATHRRMAQRIAAAIRQELGW